MKKQSHKNIPVSTKEELKKFCIIHACNVFQAQSQFEDYATATPLELAQKFYKWITSQDEDKQQV